MAVKCATANWQCCHVSHGSIACRPALTAQDTCFLTSSRSCMAGLLPHLTRCMPMGPVFSCMVVLAFEIRMSCVLMHGICAHGCMHSHMCACSIAASISAHSSCTHAQFANYLSANDPHLSSLHSCTLSSSLKSFTSFDGSCTSFC